MTGIADLSSVRMALLARQVRAQSAAVLRADPIAIIGIGCRLPGGAADPEAFWRLLCDGVDAVRDVPPARWDAARSYDPDPSAPGKAATKSGGFLDAVDGFDAGFFGITRREAERMDPQQRLFLEVAIEALDRAGLSRERLAGSKTGAFVASYYNDYAHMAFNSPETIDARTLTGCVHSVLVNRLSHLLDLRGPSVSVDTACSSSLVAVHLACQSLRAGESDLALAGGVSLMISDGLMVALSKVGFMAPDGRCKTFDASADGFGRGEGCGVLVLKRLSDAVADGDRVLAVVRGTAVNQDGHSTVLAAPNGLAQQAVIMEALANGQVPPDRINYVEAHGTGTALGDPIEVEALAATIGTPSSGGPCWLGTAKANIGHLEAAAGVVGVIKAVLVLQHGAVPPQVHFRKLNPHISLEGTRFRIPTELTPLPASAQPRCAGVSGFGVGGTNAHVIVEEAPQLAADDVEVSSAEPWALPLSAQSPEALRELATRWVEFVTKSSRSVRVLAATAGDRRSHYDHRLAVIAGDLPDLISRLRAFVDGKAPAGWTAGALPESGVPRIAFVYSGQGQQWPGMGRELFAAEPVFREALTLVDDELRRHVPWSLIDELNAPEDRSRLDETEIAQPAIFGVQVALSALWRAWGITPDGVVGHSIGELAALHVAGVLSLAEAVRIVVQRAIAMQRATGTGAMAAVGMTEAEARSAIAPFAANLSIAAVNSPRGVVLSGEKGALAQVVAEASVRGVRTRELPVNYAFHSAQMEPHAAALVAGLGAVTAGEPTLPVYSTVTGAPIESGMMGVEYFGRNVREPVRFGAAIDAMLDDGFTVFVEIGAHPVLSGSIAEVAEARGREILSTASLKREKGERETMLQALAALYVAARTPNWGAVNGGPAEVIDLPAYPWQRERYWLPEAPAVSGVVGLPGRRVDVAGATVFESRWPDQAPGWLADHRVAGCLLMPGMAMLESLRRTAAAALDTERVALTDFVVHRPLVLDEEGTTTWQCHAGPADHESVELTLYAALAPDWPNRWSPVASARAAAVPQGDAIRRPDRTPSVDGADERVRAHYRRYADLGVEFGPGFQALTDVRVNSDRVAARLRSPDTSTGALHPAVLDGALQACIAAEGGGAPERLFVPIGVDRFEFFGGEFDEYLADGTFERTGAGTIKADFELRRPDGQLVARVAGARLAVADRTALPSPRAQRDDWLHEVRWVPADDDAHRSDGAAVGAWVVLTDPAGVGEALARRLTAAGNAVAMVTTESTTDLGRFVEDDSWRRGHMLVGVICAIAPERAAGSNEPDGMVASLSAVLDTIRTLTGAGEPPQLVLVTCGAVGDSAVGSGRGAAVWGLGAAAAVEHPELSIRLIDIDPDLPAPDVELLAVEVARGRPGPPRVALRASGRLVPRLRRLVPAVDEGEVHLSLGTDRTIDGLAWRSATVAEPGPREVRVRVAAAGINFRDVLLSLGMIPEGGRSLGAECAGTVEALGPDVRDLAVGDAVFGFVPGGLGSAVVVPAAFLARWPAHAGTLEVAAAQPVAYLTAMLGLIRLAGLRRGQRILIHAGAGGVGLAAIALARRAGAEIFATAGSPAKRDLLRAVGVRHVLDSRSLDFADRILEITAGQGVDVVLNSLAGEFIAASVRALARTGCFLELGKRDVWSTEDFARARPDGQYHVYDLGEAAQAAPGMVRPMLADLLAGMAEGSLPLLPVRVFDFPAVADAFRYMAQGRHTGKLVLRNPRGGAGTRDIVRPDATYLITGGTGALGLHTARWLADLGARTLVLTSRSGGGESAQAAVEACEAAGATVHVRRADAGDRAQMTGLLEEIRRDMPPLRGVIHAAGVLRDGVLLNQDREQIADTLRAKAQGARLLDELTRAVPLDFFVLYSSAGLWLGPMGQGPYAAANAELDALALARRAAGLPALSVAWGAWQEGGMASAIEAGRAGWAGRGLGWITPAPGFARLARLLRDGVTHAIVLPINWETFLSQARPGLDTGFFTAFVASPDASARRHVPARATAVADEWRRLPESQRLAAVRTHLTEQARQMLGLSATGAVDGGTALRDLGLDSLMAVELRNALARSVGEALPATLLFDHPSIDALAAYLIRRLNLAGAGEAASANVATDPTASLDDLTEEEAEAALLAELDRPDGSTVR